MDVPYGPLAPDAGEDTVGVMMQADGVIPLQQGYGPFPGLGTAGTAAAPSGGAPRGLFSYQKADGSWQTVVGTATTIELKSIDDTWSVIDSGLMLTEGDDWCFVKFGSYLLYTNTTQGLRAYNIETGGAASAITSAGAPRWIAECGNMLFGFDCLDSTGSRNNRLIRSTKFSDHTAWTGAGTDYQPLEGGGALLWAGRASSTALFVQQQRRVSLVQVGNVGGGALWGNPDIAEEFGGTGAKSCVAFDGAMYWQATDGFRRFTGAGIEQIGAGLIDQWFLSRVDQSDLSLTQGTIDPFRKNVLWRYKGPNATSSVIFGDVVGYNWQYKRWFTLTIDTSYLGYHATPGLTWDQGTGTWDDQATSWDSRVNQGGQPLFGAMDADFKWGNFADVNMAATLETAMANSGSTNLINWATPIDDASAGTLELGVKDLQSGNTTWKTGAAKTNSGHVPLRGRGLNIGMRRNISVGATWSYAKGVDHVGAARGGPK